MTLFRIAFAAAGLVLCGAVALVLTTPARGQGPGCYISHYVDDPYSNTQSPVYECPNGQPKGPPVMQGKFFASIAKSASTWGWGYSVHKSSAAAAEAAAIADCNLKGSRDCKVAVTGVNNCLSLALSKSDGAWSAQASDMDRSGAISKATNDCRQRGGRSCAVVISPCGRSAEGAAQCNPQYKVDISRGEAWQHMTPEQKAMWNRQGNGNCTPK